MTTTAVLSPSSVVMRAARGSDGDALARLAALDSKRAPRGDFLVAEVDGAIHAAIQLDDGLVDRQPVPPDRRPRRAARAARGRRRRQGPAQPPRPGRAARAAPRAARAGRVSVTTAPPRPLPAGAPADGAPAAAPGWQIWTGLWIVYLVWGSTYLAIRVVVETVPPFLSAGARFGFAGAAMLAFLAARRGRGVLRPTREQLLSCLAVGTLLMGANAVRQRRRGRGALEHGGAADRLRAAVGDPLPPRARRARRGPQRRRRARRLRRRRRCSCSPASRPAARR